MNEGLISNINRTVSPCDTLYILGDISYKIPREESVKLVSQINCNDIRLVKGNHDKDYSGMGLFTSIEDYTEFKYGRDNRRFCLFHFPILYWAGQRGGSIHLHGHIHSKGDEYNIKNLKRGVLRYDVGVDANSYRPICIDEIISLVKRYSW